MYIYAMSDKLCQPMKRHELTYTKRPAREMQISHLSVSHIVSDDLGNLCLEYWSIGAEDSENVDSLQTDV